MSHQEVYIVAAVRSPIGKAPRGHLSQVRPDDLLASVIRGLLSKVPQFDHARLDDVIIGCAMPEAEQGMNVARISLLLAGLPDSVPGMTVNRFCSSGLQTIALAANQIALGQADLIIAGGTESMSMIPLGGHTMRANPAYFSDHEQRVGMAYTMGITAEKVAAKYNISREMQDEFSLWSHQKALKAIQAAEFKEEIIPIEVNKLTPDLKTGEIKRHTQTIDTDEGPRADTTLEKLAQLRPVFANKGSVTAGSSSQTSDGAGAVLLVSEKALHEFGFTPLAKFKGFAVAGVPPEIMGIGPIKAVPKVLASLNMDLSHIDWIELNEAFAAQSLAVIQDLHLDKSKVNPLGGAIALGHPLGATGAMRMATVVHGLRRHKLRYGMVTMCIGTGMGAAGVIERV